VNATVVKNSFRVARESQLAGRPKGYRSQRGRSKEKKKGG